MRKSLPVLLLIISVLSLSACGAKPNDANKTETDTAVVSLTPAVTEPVSATQSETGNGSENKTNQQTETQNTASAVPVPEASETPAADSSAEEMSQEEQIANYTAPNGSTEYERYQAMSGEEQEAFYDSFESPEAFFAWLNAAKAEYEALYPAVDIGDGEIDLSNLSNSGN